jgi:hypothetical protein
MDVVNKLEQAYMLYFSALCFYLIINFTFQNSAWEGDQDDPFLG